MKWWYLTCESTLEYAVVYAYNKREAFKKLMDNRSIHENEYNKWKVEELRSEKYDGILYFS